MKTMEKQHDKEDYETVKSAVVNSGFDNQMCINVLAALERMWKHSRGPRRKGAK
jgi:hypothetical protein